MFMPQPHNALTFMLSSSIKRKTKLQDFIVLFLNIANRIMPCWHKSFSFKCVHIPCKQVSVVIYILYANELVKCNFKQVSVVICFCLFQSHGTYFIC